MTNEGIKQFDETMKAAHAQSQAIQAEVADRLARLDAMVKAGVQRG